MILIKILKYVLTGIQLLLLIGIGVLERLTKTHGLVMQHVYAKKIYYMKYLTDVNRFGIAIFLIMVSISLFVIFRNRGIKFLLSYFCVTVLALAVLVMPTTTLMTYAYLVTVILVIVVLEFFKFGLKERHL